MTHDQASRERERLWRELKPLLIRSLGRQGAAEWLSFAGAQMSREAERETITLPAAEFTP